ncbi:hypothetical protein PIB30_038520 [Stylosanthes scabra]|uniref:Uncharacterized protein n=1 Tax=Stylosanthes scabra TaxID=79078 RepID=A0ABU6UFZ8_9FABA|nr:hypothetical protein [Stylosanthes scabra]
MRFPQNPHLDSVITRAEHGYRVPDYPSGPEPNQLYWFSTRQRETQSSTPTAPSQSPPHTPQATAPTLSPSPFADIAGVIGVPPARLTSPRTVIVASPHLAVARSLSLDFLALSSSLVHLSGSPPNLRPPARVEIAYSRLLTAHFNIAYGYFRSPRPVTVILRERRRQARPHPLCRPEIRISGSADPRYVSRALQTRDIGGIQIYYLFRALQTRDTLKLHFELAEPEIWGVCLKW